MQNKEIETLSNTRAVLSVFIPIVATIVFFVSMQTDVDGNTKDIASNSYAIEELEARMDSMNKLIIENNTNIKLVQKDISIIVTQTKGGQ